MLTSQPSGEGETPQARKRVWRCNGFMDMTSPRAYGSVFCRTGPFEI